MTSQEQTNRLSFSSFEDEPITSKEEENNNNNNNKNNNNNEEDYDHPVPMKFGKIFELESVNKNFQPLNEGNESNEVEKKQVQGTVCGLQVSWISETNLLDFHDLPDWVKDNEFVKTCYRTELNIKQAFASIFQLHCETGNIWTHLIAAIFSMWLCAFTLFHSFFEYDVMVMIVFFFGSISVYVMSFLFHTLYICSPESNSLLAKLDYVGIVAGIWGGETSTALAMFRCSPLKYVFVPLLFILAVVCTILSVEDRFRASKYRVIRTSVFVIFGLCGIFPGCTFIFLHWDCITTNDECYRKVIDIYVPFGSMAASFLLGAALYAARIPERWWPGKFDIIGHSHQIWHCAIVSGFCFLYYYLCIILDSKDTFASECSY